MNHPLNWQKLATDRGFSDCASMFKHFKEAEKISDYAIAVDLGISESVVQRKRAHFNQRRLFMADSEALKKLSLPETDTTQFTLKQMMHMLGDISMNAVLLWLHKWHKGYKPDKKGGYRGRKA